MTTGGRVGFVGLGTMGAPMAARVLNAGFDLAVYDVREENTQEIRRNGATVPGSLNKLAAQSDVIMVAVVNDAQVREVVHGEGDPQSILGGARPGTVVLIHSTIHPDLCRELAAVGASTGVKVLDAPMTGSPSAAAQGKLSIMVGGDQEALETARPVLEAVATRVTYLGPSGNGQIAKISNNLAIAVTMRAVREALALAGSFGIEADTMLPLLASGGADSWVARSWKALGATAEHYPGGAKGLAELTHKDVALALALAHRSGIAVPSAAVASQFLDDAYAGAYELSQRVT